MRESLASRIFRWRVNLFPAYRGTGGRVTFVDAHWREVRFQLPLARRTRNLVGTIYGGSIYGAADPFYMIMLIQRLGPGYVVWDKSASIRFRKPGRSTLYASCRIADEELDLIREALEVEPKVDRLYTIHWADAGGEVHATIEKVVHIRKRASRD